MLLRERRIASSKEIPLKRTEAKIKTVINSELNNILKIYKLEISEKAKQKISLKIFGILFKKEKIHLMKSYSHNGVLDKRENDSIWVSFVRKEEIGKEILEYLRKDISEGGAGLL